MAENPEAVMGDVAVMHVQRCQYPTLEILFCQAEESVPGIARSRDVVDKGRTRLGRPGHIRGGVLQRNAIRPNGLWGAPIR